MENVQIYKDDILVISSAPFVIHLQLLSQVLMCLENKNQPIKHNKVRMGKKNQVNYLGFILSRQGIWPQEQKMRRFYKWNHQLTLSKLTNFGALSTFTRIFSDNYLIIPNHSPSFLGKIDSFEIVQPNILLIQSNGWWQRKWC